MEVIHTETNRGGLAVMLLLTEQYIKLYQISNTLKCCGVERVQYAAHQSVRNKCKSLELSV